MLDQLSTIENPHWLTVKTAALYASLSEKSVRRLLDSGKLRRHTPIGGRILIDVDELDSLIRGATQQVRRGRGRK